MSLHESPVVLEDLDAIASRLPESAVGAFRGKSILITGATGLIGTYACLTLLHLNQVFGIGCTIIATTRDASAARKRFAGVAETAGLSIIEHDATAPLNTRVAADFIFQAASHTTPGAFRNDPVGTIQSNIYGAQHLLEALRERGSGRFVFLSTREVYGRPLAGERWAAEHDFGAVDPVDPRSCYPESKRAAEALTTAYRTQHGVDSVIIRLAHVFGPGMNLRDGRVVGDFVGALRDREPIVMNSDGVAELALTYIADAITGLLLAAAIGRDPVYNVAADSEICTVADLAQMVASLDPSITVARNPPDAATFSGYLKYPPAFLRSDRLRELGWAVEIDLEEGMQRMARHLAP